MTDTLTEGIVIDYKNLIETYCETHLADYIGRINRSSRVQEEKEFNDPIWQTIVLNPFEVIILDSPLMQRLRGYRQLGVVHWTYYSAEHSRLQHSIGTVHQVQRLIDTINRQLARSNGNVKPLEKEWINLLRLAALCHDIGHGLMSHVSENVLYDLEIVENLKIELAKQFPEKSDVSLSEAAAYFMIGSPSFKRLIEIAKQKTDYKLPPDAASFAQKAIFGRAIHDRFPLLQDLISGPFDADKLDYMTRDARMTGVPIVTDIPRLVQKVKIVELKQEQLPHEAAKMAIVGQPSYVLHGISLSGAATLDELIFGRTLLFEKVYRHQKTRATEGMIHNILSVLVSELPQLTTESPAKIAILPLLLNDFDIIQVSKELLEERLGISIASEQWEKIKIVMVISKRLRERNHFVRGYAFSQVMPNDPFANDPRHKSGLDQLQREIKHPETRGEITGEITEIVKSMKAILPDDVAPDIPVDEIINNIVLDPPNPYTRPSEIGRAYVIAGNRELRQFRDAFGDTQSWSNAYLLTRDLGYVFTDESLANAVFLACEIVFRKRYEVKTPPGATDYAKINKAKLNDIRKKLTESGFYDSYPNDLRSEPECFNQAASELAINEIVKKLSVFEGVTNCRSASRDGHGENLKQVARVDSSRVRTWLKQFKEEKYIHSALNMLSKIRILNRGDLHSAIDGFIRANPQFKGAAVCQLGDPKDSSVIMTYYAGDMEIVHDLKCMTMTDALGVSDKPILFVDDFIGSGSQCATILYNWLGIEDPPLKEKHGDPLPDVFRQELIKRNLGFLFVFGMSQGMVKLQEESTKLKLNVMPYIHIPENDIPQAFNDQCVTYTEKQEFVHKCTEIGKQLLAKTDHDAEWVDERSLGYGNKGYLLAFPYNVPSQTLTLLWGEGKVDDWDWLPLLPRRKKYN